MNKLLVKVRANNKSNFSIPIEKEVIIDPAKRLSTNSIATGMNGEAIEYNYKQQEFIQISSSGKNCVLIGAAGTGKTTCTKGAIKALIDSSHMPILNAEGHKHLPSGAPGIIIVAFTRRAVNNIRKVQSEDLKFNCMTVHKLLEYAPVYYDTDDPITGETKRTMKFEPFRDASNPLPSSIRTIIVEESSMLSVDLFNEMEAALDHDVQWVFIGDIQQLAPVFGPAILGFKMLEYPIIELTEVYRQALKSPIIRLAHRILSGKVILGKEFDSWKEESPNGSLTIHAWKKKIKDDAAVETLSSFFKKAIHKNIYNPYEDIILIPFNVNCGAIELNKYIANYLAKQRQSITYEVMAGFNKVYFSIGDRVLYDREDAEIVSIETNHAYAGARVQPKSIHLDYWGFNPKMREDLAANHMKDNYDERNVDLILEQVAGDSETRVTQASHEIVVRLLDTGTEVTITKANDIKNLLLAYAITVHKAQGSEWRKVFFILHQSHACMIQRELLYTAVTRAKEELYIICEPESMVNGIRSQKIKGNTLKEKAEYFKGKVLNYSRR